MPGNPFWKALRKESLIMSGGILASSIETIVPVIEEGTAATETCCSETLAIRARKITEEYM